MKIIVTGGSARAGRFILQEMVSHGYDVAIPNPLMAPEHEVFRVNMVSNWNVLEAAEIHDIPKLALASSVNAIGAVFSKAPGPGVFSH